MAIYGFSKRLQGAIWKSGLSNREIAKRAHISRGLLYAYLNGQSTPTGENLMRLCDVLKVSSDWLLGLKKE